MWSGLVRAITPQSRRLEIPINPLATPPHFPPFERKSSSGQFEIVHAPTHQALHNTITLPTGLLVLESSTSTPRNDLLHDILISIPQGHWTKLKDHQGHFTALQTLLLLVKSPLIREVHRELIRAHQEGGSADHSSIYSQIGYILTHHKQKDTPHHHTNCVPPIWLGNKSATTSQSNNNSITHPCVALTPS